MRWRLLLEEYSPELRYIKGEDNIVADALSRLDMVDADQRQTEQLSACLLYTSDAADE